MHYEHDNYFAFPLYNAEAFIVKGSPRPVKIIVTGYP